MSEYIWNRLTPDTCTCGFERKVHLADRCPWDRDDIKEFQRQVMGKSESKRNQEQRK